MKQKIFQFLALVAIAVGLSACNDSNNDGPVIETYQQFATLQSVSDNGSTFGVWNSATSGMRVLTSSEKIPASVCEPGQRLIILYQLMSGTSPEGSGSIALLAVMPVINGTVTEKTAAETGQWASNSVQEFSYQLTGNYLDLHFLAQMASEPKDCQLYVDQTTLADAYPVVYLIYEADNIATSTWKNVYASFDVSPILKDYVHKGFILKCANETGPKSFTVQRDGQEPLQPMN